MPIISQVIGSNLGQRPQLDRYFKVIGKGVFVGETGYFIG